MCWYDVAFRCLACGLETIVAMSLLRSPNAGSYRQIIVILLSSLCLLCILIHTQFRWRIVDDN